MNLSGIQRITGIAISTQIRIIRQLGKSIVPTPEYKQGDIYEVDELRTYVGRKKKKRWVVIAKSRKTGRVIDMQSRKLSGGTRSKKTLKRVIKKLLALNPEAIYTDGLNLYRYIIPLTVHKDTKYGTNHVERFNLSLRTHISRLNRKTICYSKSLNMLEYTLKIYLWG